MERRKILVAFGDILGFGTWTRRALTTPEDSKDLIDKIYYEFENYSNLSGCYVKFLGDGIMSIREIRQKRSDSNAGITLKFIHDINALSEKIRWLIKCHFPRPDGFRVRATAGHAWRIPLKHHKPPEYVGYIVNLAQRLLEISPQTPFICHESIKEILGNKKTDLKLDRFVRQKEKPRGVDIEDLDQLWSLKITESIKEKTWSPLQLLP